MSRWWNERVAAITDVIPLPLLVFGLVLLALIIGALWFFWPAWVPRRLPRLPRRGSRRRRAQRLASEVIDLAEEPAEAAALADRNDLPDLPVAAFASLADRLATEGRFAEAIRERLRLIARDLVDHDVTEQRPGWTVTELARAAVTARPALGTTIAEATTIFSDVWYGMLPATVDHDQRMRVLVTAVHDVLVAAPVAPGGNRR